jgi:anti-anti-sigma regulatory factor
VTLSGRLDLDGVEDLAACADQICRGAVRTVVFDVADLTTVDEAGARTLAAAFGCLASHGVAATVVGVGAELHAMLDRLALTLVGPADQLANGIPAGRTGVAWPSAGPAGAARSGLVRGGGFAARPSAGLVGLAVARQGAADGLGVGHAARGDGGHDLVELPGLLRADAVKQRPPDLLDV